MDEFQEKRGMIKMLLDMLKHSASDEVMNGMKVPEGMPADAKGLEVEKVSVLPHDEHMEGDEMSPEDATLADKVMSHGDEKMSEGGMVMDEPKEMPLPMDDDDMDDENPLPPFSSLMGKKKGKK